MNRRSFLKTTAIGASVAISPMQTFAQNAKPKIKVGYIPITDHLTIIAKGLEAYQNVEFEPVKFSAWPDIVEAIRAGAIDGAFLLSHISIQLKLQNVPVKGLMAGHRNGSVITVKNTDEINKVSDLKGKNIAVPSRFSLHFALIQKVLKDNGINPDTEVKLIDMAPPEMVSALANGKIDAFIVAEPFGAQAMAQKVGKPLMYTGEIWSNHICCILNMREEVIANHKDAVQELVTGFIKTASYIEKNPLEASVLSRKFLGQKPEIIEFVIESPKNIVNYNDLIITKNDFDITQDYMINYGVTKARIDETQYLDNSFAQNAYKALTGKNA
ncbi:MAG: ABC transporter substrate-binding protein [Campylobacteraceae bacterium]